MCKLIYKLRATAIILSLMLMGCTKIIPPGKLVLSDVRETIYIYNYLEGDSLQTFKVVPKGNYVWSIAAINKSKICFGCEDRTSYSLENWRNNLLSLNIDENKLDTLIYNYPGKINYPNYSLANSKIAFIIEGKCRGGKGPLNVQDAQCVVIDLPTKKYKTITGFTLALGKPSWSLDGQSLWVSSYEGKIIRIDTSGNIVEKLGKGFCPTLSPDGKYLAYLDGNTIFVMELITKKIKTVASWYSFYIPNPHYDISITWSPDSKYIGYEGRNLICYITKWASQFVVVSSQGKGISKKVCDFVAAGAGAAWVP